MRILTAEQMAAVDRRAIDEIGVPGMVLMENAALGVVDALGEVFAAAERIVVLCGPGNNGGDGLAIARHLDLRGYSVRTLLLVPAEKLSGDATMQLQILRRQGPTVVEVSDDEASDDDGSGDDVAGILKVCADSDVVIDALFGTGLSRPLEGRFAALAEGLNGLSTPVVAVDIPSGLNGSTGEPPGPHVAADLTVTFGAPKLAHVFPPAAASCGRLVVADLGIARHLIEEAPGALHLLTEAEVRGHLAPRDAEGHKGDYGHAAVIGGSPGMSGAVVLATRAAVRSGAGLVTALVPPELLHGVDAGSVESMTLPYLDPFDEDALSALLDFVAARQAVALGPGMGTEPETQDFVRRLARAIDRPLVIDADGLNALAGHHQLLADRGAPTVLTPHPGEAARLLESSTSEVQADRLGAVRELARRTGAAVVLKGHRSLIAEPPSDAKDEDEEITVWVNPTGNPGLATGGSGDVLTGVVAALLARGWDAAAAARIGVYVHGLAGDLAAATMGETAMAAGDVVDHLPAAWRRLETPQEPAR